MNIPQRVVILLTGLAIVVACVFVPWKIKDTLRLQVFPSGGTVWLGHNASVQYDAFNGALADNDGIHWQALSVELLAILATGCTLYWVVSPRRPTMSHSEPHHAGLERCG